MPQTDCKNGLQNKIKQEKKKKKKNHLFDDQRERLVPLLALGRVGCAVAFRIKAEMYFRKI